jgi:hypothetical protein
MKKSQRSVQLNPNYIFSSFYPQITTSDSRKQTMLSSLQKKPPNNKHSDICLQTSQVTQLNIRYTKKFGAEAGITFRKLHTQTSAERRPFSHIILHFL